MSVALPDCDNVKIFLFNVATPCFFSMICNVLFVVGAKTMYGTERDPARPIGSSRRDLSLLREPVSRLQSVPNRTSLPNLDFTERYNECQPGAFRQC